jgi:hypothetical protein
LEPVVVSDRRPTQQATADLFALLERVSEENAATLRRVREDNANTRRFLRRIERRLDEEQNTDATLTVEQFCRKEGIHRDTFYELLKAGRGPVVMRVGDPVKGAIRISAQARWDWQRAREAEANALAETTVAAAAK